MKKIDKSGNNRAKDSPESERIALELMSKHGKHENIINFFKYFEDHDSYNFILEYCPYGSL